MNNLSLWNLLWISIHGPLILQWFPLIKNQFFLSFNQWNINFYQLSLLIAVLMAIIEETKQKMVTQKIPNIGELSLQLECGFDFYLKMKIIFCSIQVNDTAKMAKFNHIIARLTGSSCEGHCSVQNLKHPRVILFWTLCFQVLLRNWLTQTWLTMTKHKWLLPVLGISIFWQDLAFFCQDLGSIWITLKFSQKSCSYTYFIFLGFLGKNNKQSWFLARGTT